MEFIEKLSMLMYKKHYNKSDLSRASGVPYTTIDGIFKRGGDKIQLSTLKRLSDALGCSIDFLADDELDVDIYKQISDELYYHCTDSDFDNPEQKRLLVEIKKLDKRRTEHLRRYTKLLLQEQKEEQKNQPTSSDAD